LAALAKSYVVHCVGHAHIDMNWMWSWPETVAVANDTFGTVLGLLDEFPHLCFSQSQASLYAVMERYHPQLLDRITKYVREGRWEVTASHWVENDKNMVDGESLCRHILYTRRYMQRLFGLTPEDVPIDWACDTFGHAATVPAYLVRGGIKYVYLHRPGAHHPHRPAAFWWEAPDGSRVLVRNDMWAGYNGVIEPGTILLHLPRFVDETRVRGLMLVFGVGDHGGGPTRRDILRAIDMDTWPVFPRVKFSTARLFFELLEKEGANLPVVKGELNCEFGGCYTTQTTLKMANRRAEGRLLDAESVATLCMYALGQEYPSEAFHRAWENTLFSQFHDLLGGSCGPEGRIYSLGLHQETMALTSIEQTKALRLLAAHIDTSFAGDQSNRVFSLNGNDSLCGAGAGFGTATGGVSQASGHVSPGLWPLLVFNPTGTKRREVVEATVWMDGHFGEPETAAKKINFTVVFPDGSLVPAQALETGRYWGHEFVRLAFPVEVEGLGYICVAVRAGGNAKGNAGVWHLGRGHHCPYSFYERSPEGLENDLVRLEVDPVSGGICSLLHKPSGMFILGSNPPAPLLEYAVERPHHMTAWLTDHTGRIVTPHILGIRRTLAGPHRASLEIRLKIHASEFRLTYELRSGDPNLYVRLAGTWFERGTPEHGVPVLSLSLPLRLRECRATYEIPFGALSRDLPCGEESPALRWVRVVGCCGQKRAGVLLLNDGRHGHSLHENTLRMTLFRSSYDPDPFPEIGQHEVHMAIRPFVGEPTPDEAIRIAQCFNRPLLIVGTDLHQGSLPPVASLVKLTCGSAVLSGLKKAEDDDAIIFRFYEACSKPTKVRIVPNRELMGVVTRAVGVDLLEREARHPSVRLSKGSVLLNVPAHGIESVKVTLSRRSGSFQKK
ncbi:MAG: glycosyl hydrolase-related protein, partial [Kiritimatiellae bacterium]|nr:glycosyl hydrolase-related protein [Kiritimatiellia bacterium]